MSLISYYYCCSEEGRQQQTHSWNADKLTTKISNLANNGLQTWRLVFAFVVFQIGCLV